MLDQGRIVERGIRAELMTLGWLYAATYRRQMGDLAHALLPAAGS